MILNGAALAAIRKRSGIRGSDLARAAGISPSYLHELETSRKGKAAKRELLDALAAGLDVDVAAITNPKAGAA